MSTQSEAATGVAQRLLRHLRQHGFVSLLRTTAQALSRASLARARIIRKRSSFLQRTFSLRFRVTRIAPTPDPDLVVSLTSFPARIGAVWATIETLFAQTVRPDAIVLVLALDEFPDRRLPRSLQQQKRRGLTVLWTETNTRSYKKLLPTRRAYPGATIVTVDDDVLYRPELLEELLEASARYPSRIIGHRGWNPLREQDGYRPYLDWIRSGPAGPASDPDEVFLTGCGGVLYPLGAPPDALLLDVDRALELAPTADDVWFWGTARAAGVQRHCTGRPFGSFNGLEGLSPKLFAVNKVGNDAQVAAVIANLRRTDRADQPALAPADAALVAAVSAPVDDTQAPFDLQGLAAEVGASVTLLESVARAGLLLPHHVDEVGVARYSAADAETVRAGLALLDAGLPLAELLALAGPTDAAVRDVAERAVEAFLRFVRDPVLGTSDDDAAAGERLVTAYERMLPATERLVAHHLRRRLIIAALERLADEGAPVVPADDDT